VDKLGTPRRSSRGKVSFFAENNIQTATRSIGSDAGSIDAATDYEEIMHRFFDSNTLAWKRLNLAYELAHEINS
jgi:hypothetical protein